MQSTAIVSGMTMISRMLGFIRDAMFAIFFGANANTDIFFVAFKIPNFLRRLFAEGAFSQAFVPVLVDYKEGGSREALKQFIDRTAGGLVLALLATTIVGMVAAPLLIMVFAPGFFWQEGQYDLAVQMLRITFPYLFFISLVAFAGGILNAHGKFAIPALTPAFLNICLIAVTIWLAPLMEEPIVVLAWGVFIAGVVQLLLQLPALKRMGLLPKPVLDFHDLGVKRVMRLMLPALFGVSVTQINMLLDTLLASFLSTGSISWLYYSDRLVEFPLGVLGIALGVVILPRMAKSYANQDADAFSHCLDWGLRCALLVGLPASIGLFLLAEPILATLFQYQEFSRFDTVMAARSLMAYAVGLISFMLVKILVPGFSARKDMKIVVRFGIYAVGANMLLNIIFILPLAHAGLALATSLGAFLNAGLLLKKLLQDRIYRPKKGWRLFMIRIFLANSALAYLLYRYVDFSLWVDGLLLNKATYLAFWVVVGIVFYGLILLLLGLRWQHLSYAKK